MKALVAITDSDWYEFLRSRPDLEEANFWQPSGSTNFRALSAGEPMLFKLHAPNHFIVGGGFFAHFSRLPYHTAWEFFGENNGAPSLQEMRRRIEKYRRAPSDPFEDYEIGCIMLNGLFFFDEKDWIAVPGDFARNIVRYKGYDLTEAAGRELWEQVEHRLRAGAVGEPEGVPAGLPAPQPSGTIESGTGLPPPHPSGTMGPWTGLPSLYGDPTLTRPRLGQGTFRALITDTYQRRCAVTRERALPVLEAAHIRPVSEGGLHQVDNGLLLRSDIHRLFDRGYVTVAPDYTFHVSRKLKEDFENGEPYYPLEKTRILVPWREREQPNREFLEWHAERVFRG